MKIHKSLHQHIALVFFFVMVVYYPAIFAPFTSIDDLRMIDHLFNTDEFTFQGLFLPHCTGTYYRPLLYLTFIGDKYLWGLEASFMHLENILLHLGNSLLVFFLVRQLLAVLSIEAGYSPLVAALLFGLHPITTEPVNWISGRTDLLAGFFVLAALVLFLQSIRSSSLWYGLSAALLLLAGCLSKETALFLLPAMLLWAAFPPKDGCTDLSPLRRSLHCVILSAAGGCYLVLRWAALSGGDRIARSVNKVGATVQDDHLLGLSDKAMVVTRTAGFYFKKLIVPLPLNFGIDSISPHYFWLGLLVFAGIVWCLCRRDIIAYLFVAAFMLTSSAFILPLLNITWTPVAERYIYIAAAPFVVGVTLLYLKYINQAVSARLATLAIAGVLGGSAVATAQRSIVWQDNYSLYKDTMEKSPGFGVIVNEYALALRGRGQCEEADRIMLENRVGDFQQASLNKIRVLTNKGQLEEARELLMQRIDKGAEYKQVLLELLAVIDESRRTKARGREEQQILDREILITYQELLALTGDPFYHYKIGRLQLGLNNRIAAKKSFAEAWQGAPQHSHYREAARKLSERL